VISQAGQPEGQPDLKKPTALRGAVGVWNCENSDRRAVAVEKLRLNVSRIIPGDRGKVGLGWLVRLLLSRPKGR